MPRQSTNTTSTFSGKHHLASLRRERPASNKPSTSGSPRYHNLLSRLVDLEAALEVAARERAREESSYSSLKDKYASTKAALAELKAEKMELEKQSEATMAKWRAHHDRQVKELAIFEQQAEELAKLSSLRTQWAQEAEDLKAECETFRSLYDSARAEAEKSKEEFIAVVEDQARSQKEMTNAARLEAEQMQARVRELEEEVEQGRSREEVRRQLERDLDVAHAALRQSQAVVQATEEARERVEVQSQREGVIHEAQLAEWMAKAAAVTSERKGLEARIEGLEKELAQAVEERRGKRLELEEAAEEIGRLREALEISERAVEEGRRKATREGEELRRVWREEKSEWDEKIERLERQLQRTETEMKELRRERLVADERLAASEENTRHGAGEEVRRLQERVADLEEALEEERVRGIKVENDWKFVVRDLHRQLRGPTPPERCPHADSMAPGIGAEAEEMAATARDQSFRREERQEEDLRAMTLLREELEKVKLRSMLAIQKAERRADAYKSKCLELHERWKESSVVGGL